MFMSIPPLLHAMNSEWTRMLPIALLCGMLVWPQVVAAQSTSPFAKFSGNWRGSGQVVGSNGNREKIRCRADYSTSSTGQSLSQSIVCASDSYNFDIRSFVVAEAQNAQGHWEELVRQVTGQLTGQIIDGQFEGNISGPGFTADMSLNSTGQHQTLDIRPQGGDISRVQVTLSRAR